LCQMDSLWVVSRAWASSSDTGWHRGMYGGECPGLDIFLCVLWGGKCPL